MDRTYGGGIRPPRLYEHYVPTLRTGNHGFEVIEIIDRTMAKKYRIRKLTPTECFRCMDVPEEDIKKMLNAGISNSRLYMLAGNSIVVACLEGIFTQMFSTSPQCGETLFG